MAADYLVFTTHIFVFYFLPVVLLIYYLLPSHRNAFLTLASYVFYGWWEPWFVLLMMTSTLVDYICGGIIATPGASETRRRTALVTAIVCDLGCWDSQITRIHGRESERSAQYSARALLPVLAITLPIDFFYALSEHELHHRRYRGVVQRARRCPISHCFISLFPHLVADRSFANVVAERLQSATTREERARRGLFIPA